MTQTRWIGAQWVRLVGAGVVGAGLLYGALLAGVPLPTLPAAVVAAPVRYERTAVKVFSPGLGAEPHGELKRLLEAGWEIEDVQTVLYGLGAEPRGDGRLANASVYALRRPLP